MKVKSNLPFIHWFFVWITYMLCLALLLSYLAPICDPDKFWIIAFFGLSYPFILLANILITLFWLFRKRWNILLPLACISLGWGILNKNFGLHKNTNAFEVKKPDAIRIMSYNVHNFKRYGAKNDISTKREILAIIKEQKPDIIGLQEFYTRPNGQYDMKDSLIKIIGRQHYFFVPIIFNDSESIGIALFSKYPIIGKGLIHIADKGSENSCIYIDVKKGDKVFRVYSVHLQSIGFEGEDYKYIKNISNQLTTNITPAKRMGGKLKIAFVKRSRQVKLIKEHTNNCPYPYIISGDFNDTPTSFAVNEMGRGLRNAFEQKGIGLGKTYNGSFPNYQIDYIFTSPHFNILNYQLIEKKLSDHYPIWSDLELN
jgi:endonuclease/exonuclease/phosphatase family metal-dependent hydrolase